ncbi:MAG: type II toxin-antitoxin system RelE/ParE family toxin [Gammaproteobacteria bacterium]|nr:type II toxin-antitoxin system RelE/ParE family toxin [Gammaproteobacteria bacterium]
MFIVKSINFLGNALDDLRAFPQSARRAVGHQLDRLQRELEPFDWKPMKAVGPGAKEIRVHDDAGAFRAIYVTKFGDAVHVLHCFQKKSQKTALADLSLAKTRYRDLMSRRVK